MFWSWVTESRNLSIQNLLSAPSRTHFQLQKQLTPCTKHLKMLKSRNLEMLQFLMTQESTMLMMITEFKHVWNVCETNNLYDIYLLDTILFDFCCNGICNTIYYSALFLGFFSSKLSVTQISINLEFYRP